MLVIVLALCMATVGCGKGSKGGGGGGFTITDIPSQYNGKYAGLSGLAGNVIVGFQINDGDKITYPRISNGKVSIPLWRDTESGLETKNLVRYSGNDTALTIGVTIFDSENGGNLAVGIAFFSVKFSKGNATSSWKEGIIRN